MPLPRIVPAWKNAAAIVGVAAPYLVAYGWAFVTDQDSDYLIFVALPAYCQGAFFLGTRLILGPGAWSRRLLYGAGIATVAFVVPAYLPEPLTADGYDLTEYALYAAYALVWSLATGALLFALGERDARVNESGNPAAPARIRLFDLVAALFLFGVAAGAARTPAVAVIEATDASEWSRRVYEFATSRFLLDFASAVVPTAVAARLLVRAGGRWFRVRLAIGAAVGAWYRIIHGGALSNVPLVAFLAIFAATPIYQAIVLRLAGFRAINVGILPRRPAGSFQASAGRQSSAGRKVSRRSPNPAKGCRPRSPGN